MSMYMSSKMKKSSEGKLLWTAGSLFTCVCISSSFCLQCVFRHPSSLCRNSCELQSVMLLSVCSSSYEKILIALVAKEWAVYPFASRGLAGAWPAGKGGRETRIASYKEWFDESPEDNRSASCAVHSYSAPGWRPSLAEERHKHKV